MLNTATFIVLYQRPNETAQNPRAFVFTSPYICHPQQVNRSLTRIGDPVSVTRKFTAKPTRPVMRLTAK